MDNRPRANVPVRRKPAAILPRITKWGGLGLLLALSFGGLHASAQEQKPSFDLDVERAKQPKPPPSNQVVGINIDRFIGDPLLSPVHVVEDAIFERSILHHGDPYHPGDRGAVLEFWKDIAHATLLGGMRTPLTQSADEQFWYVESGKGTLDNGHGYWDLHNGVGILIPPNVRHRIINTGEEPLEMVALNFTPAEDAKPGKEILVRDVHLLTLPKEGAHWNYFGADLFWPSDGLGSHEVFTVIFIPPMSIAEPHAHLPESAEVWIKLLPDSAYLTLGSGVREMPPNTAMLSPPNSQTVHAVMNLSEDKTETWLYIDHYEFLIGSRPNRPYVEPKVLTSAP